MGLFENPSLWRDEPKSVETKPTEPTSQPEPILYAAAADRESRRYMLPLLVAAVFVSGFAFWLYGPESQEIQSVAVKPAVLPISVAQAAKREETAITTVAKPMPRVVEKDEDDETDRERKEILNLQPKTKPVLEEKTQKTTNVVKAAEDRPDNYVAIDPSHYRRNKNGQQCAWNAMDTAALTAGYADPEFSTQEKGFTYIGPISEGPDRMARLLTRRDMDVGMIRSRSSLTKCLTERKLPAIAGIQTGPKDLHVVLVVGTDKDNVWIVDNVHPEFKVDKVPANFFWNNWAGSALAVLPFEREAANQANEKFRWVDRNGQATEELEQAVLEINEQLLKLSSTNERTVTIRGITFYRQDGPGGVRWTDATGRWSGDMAKTVSGYRVALRVTPHSVAVRCNITRKEALQSMNCTSDNIVIQNCPGGT